MSNKQTKNNNTASSINVSSKTVNYQNKVTVPLGLSSTFTHFSKSLKGGKGKLRPLSSVQFGHEKVPLDADKTFEIRGLQQAKQQNYNSKLLSRHLLSGDKRQTFQGVLNQPTRCLQVKHALQALELLGSRFW